MSRIFVSYRHSDNQDATGRIYDRLAAQFGKANIFKDVDSIPLGVDFRKHLSEVVGQCQLFLAVLGTRWVDARDDAGKRRLDSPNDFVRIEIEAALARGIPVIPVLVGNAGIPSEAELPPSLSPLAFRQGISVRPDPDFHHDMDRLSAALQTWLRSAQTAGIPKTPGAPAPTDTPGDMPEKDANAAYTQPASSGKTEISTVPEPTPAELQVAGEMLARLTTVGVNQEVTPLAPVARDLFQAGQGREVPALCQILKDPKVSDVDRYKAVKLLGVALRRPQSEPFMDVALDTLLDYGVFSSSLQDASLEAIMASRALQKAKWERLFGALDLANEWQLYAIVGKLGGIIPPSERQLTGARLTELLDTATTATSPICTVLEQIGYRAGVPALISIMEMAVPWKAVLIADVLVSWRVNEAASAIREVIERARYGNDHQVAQLSKRLYALEGVVASGYLTEVLRDAIPAMQGFLLDALGDMNDSAFIDVVSDLGRNAVVESVKTKALAFLKKKAL